jgi:predicted RNase H-like HicB family nuclease
MKRSIREILDMPYARILIRNKDGSFTAQILEFPGCVAEGATPDEAIDDLDKSASSWIEGAIEQNEEIPEPLASYGYSGKINLRLPKSIHKQAARLAKKEDVSLNQFFASAIAAKVGAEDLYERLAKRLESRLMASPSVAVCQQVTSCVVFSADPSSIIRDVRYLRHRTINNHS